VTTLADRMRAFKADEERDALDYPQDGPSAMPGAPQTAATPTDDQESSRARIWLLAWAGDRWTPRGLPALPGMGIGPTGDDWSAFLLGADLAALQRARAEAEALEIRPVPIPQTAEEWDAFCRIYGGEPPELPPPPPAPAPTPPAPTTLQTGPWFGQEGGA
jgi:hypothetical protein